MGNKNFIKTKHGSSSKGNRYRSSKIYKNMRYKSIISSDLGFVSNIFVFSQYYVLTFKIPVVKCHHGIQVNWYLYQDTGVTNPALQITIKMQTQVCFKTQTLTFSMSPEQTGNKLLRFVDKTLKSLIFFACVSDMADIFWQFQEFNSNSFDFVVTLFKTYQTPEYPWVISSLFIRTIIQPLIFK